MQRKKSLMSQIGLPTKQDNCYVQIHCQAIEEAVVMRSNVIESVSCLFEIEVFLQTQKSVDVSKLINEPATVAVVIEEQLTRYFSGIIINASFENIPSTIQTQNNNILCLKIGPTLERAKYTEKHRTFQNQSAIEIIQQVLKENNVTNVKMETQSGGSQKRVFCVQYAESDFNFISRLMEEEGAFYYFENLENSDVLHISDNSVASKKIKTELKIVSSSTNASMKVSDAYNISLTNSIGIKKTTSFFYNDTKAEVVSGSSEASNNKLNIGENESYNRIFQEQTDGDKISKTNIERYNSINKSLSGNSYCPEMYSGGIFKISGSVEENLNSEFFVIEIKHVINQIPDDSNAVFYYNSFVAIPSSTAFRPSSKHEKPKMPGSYVATVVGPDGEEIHCDEQGRVLVRFPWGESCWIRVAQTWAGNGFGSLVIPRIGMEVVVIFTNGDPDEPLIIGCVYNGLNKPPANYPKEKNTASSFYTNSSKGTGYNELRFDDNAEKEEVFLHAQKDLNYIVENSVTETINEGSRTITLQSKKDPTENSLTIKKGSNKITLNEGDNTIMLNKGSYTIILDKGDQSITIKEGDQSITLSKGNLSVKVKGDISISANNISVNAEGSISFTSKKSTSIDSKDFVSIDASSNFGLNCKGASISASSSISIKAPTVKMNATMSLSIESSMTASISASVSMDIKGGGKLALSGAMINLG